MGVAADGMKTRSTFVNERGVDCGVGVNIWLSSGCADCAIPGRYCANTGLKVIRRYSSFDRFWSEVVILQLTWVHVLSKWCCKQFDRFWQLTWVQHTTCIRTHVSSKVLTLNLTELCFVFRFALTIDSAITAWLRPKLQAELDQLFVRFCQSRLVL